MPRHRNPFRYGAEDEPTMSDRSWFSITTMTNGRMPAALGATPTAPIEGIAMAVTNRSGQVRRNLCDDCNTWQTSPCPRSAVPTCVRTEQMSAWLAIEGTTETSEDVLGCVELLPSSPVGFL